MTNNAPQTLRLFFAAVLANLCLLATSHANFFDGLGAPVQVDGKWGYLGIGGGLMVPAEWDEARPAGMLIPPAVRKGERWGYLNPETGAVLIEPTYKACRDFSAKLAAVKPPVVLDLDAGDGMDLMDADPTEYWGYIDTTGKLVIPAQFTDAGDFAENGLAPAADKQKRWGYIDTKGKWVIEPQFAEARSFRGDVAVVTLANNGGQVAIGAEGKPLCEPFETLGDFVDGLAPAYRLTMVATSESLADTLFSDETEDIDDRAGKLKRANLDQQVDGAIAHGYVNPTGEWMTEAKFERAHVFSGGLACVRIDGKYGYIKPDGSYAIEPSYEDARDFTAELAAVKYKGTWIYIRPTGKRAFDRRFDQAGDFVLGVARVVSFDETFYVNTQGERVFPPEE